MIDRDQPDLIDLIQNLREELGMFAGAMPITPRAAWEQAITEVRRLRSLVADPDTLVITKDDVEQAVRTNPTQWTRWPIWALEILIPWGAAENADYHPHAILDDLLEGQPK